SPAALFHRLILLHYLRSSGRCYLPSSAEPARGRIVADGWTIWIQRAGRGAGGVSVLQVLVLPPALCPITTRRRDEQHTKTEVILSVLSNGDAAVSRAADLGWKFKRAATSHASAAGEWPHRVFYGAGAVVIRIVAVLTPLPRIAVHVVQPPGV